jgi:D-alanyl-D-alanine dipeptidase
MNILAFMRLIILLMFPMCILAQENLRHVQPISGKLLVKMAYATSHNFMSQSVYPCNECYLRPEAAKAIRKAAESAAKKGYQLMLLDCYRPRVLQYKMYEIVQNPDYVALPTKGSLHNKGLAIDLTLADKNGNPIDMGSAFDEFSTRSHFQSTEINKMQQANREVLRSIMKQAGFQPYNKEWWHFSIRKNDYQALDWVWPCDQ